MRRIFVLALLALFTQPGWAACTISAQPTSFGNYNPLSASPLDAAGQVTVNCTTLISIGLAYTIKLSTGVAGSYNPRQMKNGGNSLSYNLYLDALRVLVWGDGSGGTSFVSNSLLLTVLGFSQSYSVYGRVTPLQNVTPASYSDTITVTLEY